ncbi:hypothetical protein EX30DRAFT_365579 [Ascodesmis nigricans]|uniref:Uncharacterized protein n=1 Tax=Ascodesmis nigricans TaxID=341454 RepID=A0A4S2MSN6_9PEZI|nr:hypothetical protein EX30DRAFT_365579 [Ascodesmis nigricans]
MALTRTRSTTSTTSLPSPSTHHLLTASPPAHYISSPAASRLLTLDHIPFFQHLHATSPNAPTSISITSGSLRLVNQFLDFLLLQILLTGKAPTIPALRPAVQEVLRVKLAREALMGADQELESYLGGEEAVEGVVGEDGGGEGGFEGVRWWRRVRVQCMVYSSLGDMEEDDADDHEEDEDDEDEGEDEQEEAVYQRPRKGVAPAVAIWLTSILEFIGEQTLLVAGHAAVARYSAAQSAYSSNSGDKTPPPELEMPVVEELDAEKVAMNTSLGRMWRQWRKKVRETTGSISLPRGASLGARLSDGRKTLSLKPSFTSDVSAAPSLAASSIRSGIEEEEEGEEEEKDPQTPSSDGKDVEQGLTPRIEVAALDVSNVHYLDVPPTPKQRPHSLVVIPWTNAPPFSFFPAPKRPRSLPDLQRGDFADPVFDGREMEGRPKSPGVDHPRDTNIAEDEIPDDRNEAEFFTPAEEMPPAQPVFELEATEQKSLHVKIASPGDAVMKEASSLARTNTDVSPIDISTLSGDITTRPRAESSDLDDHLPIQHPPREHPPRPSTSSTDDVVYYPPAQATRVIPFSTPRLEDIPSGPRKPTSSSGSSTYSNRRPPKPTLLSSSHSNRVFTSPPPPPISPDQPLNARRSSSFSKPPHHRPQHTSGSISSQTSSSKLKKRVVPWTNYSNHDSDTESRTSHHSDRFFRSRDDKERSFEELISRDETIHFTTTPDPLRNVEEGFKHSFDNSSSHRISSEGWGHPPPVKKPKDRSPVPPRISIPTARHGELPALATPNTAPARFLGASTPTTSIRGSSVDGDRDRDRDTITPLTPASTAQRARTRLQAREPQGTVSSDTTTALADFFRSTNPPPGPTSHGLPSHPPRGPRTATTATFPHQTRSETITPSASVSSFTPSGSTRKIHRTPSLSLSQRKPPRSSASDRSTITTASSLHRTRASFSSSTPAPVSAPALPLQQQQRGGRRVKHAGGRDPYALPDSDDDEDLDIDDAAVYDGEEEGEEDMYPHPPPKNKLGVRAKQTGEESLIDFLRNASPPPPTPATPVTPSYQQHRDSTEHGRQRIEKKSSTLNLLSRFRGKKTDTREKPTPSSPIPISRTDPWVKLQPVQPETASGSSVRRHNKYQPIQIQQQQQSTSTLPLGYNSAYQHPYPVSPPPPSDREQRVEQRPQQQRQRPPMRVKDAREERGDMSGLARFLVETGPPAEVSGGRGAGGGGFI